MFQLRNGLEKAFRVLGVDLHKHVFPGFSGLFLRLLHSWSIFRRSLLLFLLWCDWVHSFRMKTSHFDSQLSRGNRKLCEQKVSIVSQLQADESFVRGKLMDDRMSRLLSNRRSLQPSIYFSICGIIGWKYSTMVQRGWLLLGFERFTELSPMKFQLQLRSFLCLFRRRHFVNKSNRICKLFEEVSDFCIPCGLWTCEKYFKYARLQQQTVFQAVATVSSIRQFSTLNDGNDFTFTDFCLL